MRLFWRSESSYVEQLRAAMVKNHMAIYHALVHEDANSLEHQLAEFLLSEAGWDLPTFLSAALVAELDG